MTRVEIVDSVIDSLKSILISNGYSTDMGKLVHSGLIPSIERHDTAYQCIVSARQESVVSKKSSVKCSRVQLDISIICFIPRERTNPYDNAYELINDVQKALLLTEDFGIEYRGYSLDNDVIVGSAYIPLELQYTSTYTLKV